jgi:hypothetical protein
MKECALEKLRLASERDVPRTVEELQRFFAACDQREKGEEPDWAEQRKMIEKAATSGITDT